MPDNSHASYLDIASDLKKQIASGAYQAGEKLPSESALAEHYQAPRQVIRRALAELVQKGLIETQRGKGSFVRKPEEPVIPAKRRTIMMINSSIDSYIFPNMISGIRHGLDAHNISIQYGVTQSRLANEARILRSAADFHPSGVIASPVSSALHPVNQELYEDLRRRGIPLLFINTHYPDSDIPYISLDDRKGGYIATKHLIEMGHEKIAYIGKMDNYSGHLRFAGYVDALREAGLPVDESHILWYHSTDANSWLTPPLSTFLVHKLTGCTAVFCYNDQIAYSLLEILRQVGINTPEDMSVVGYDDSNFSRDSIPPCTTIRHPSFELGCAAAENILAMMEGRSVETTLFQPVLVPRGSVRNLKK